MTLEQLAKKYASDKYEHGYMPFYEQHLPKNPKRILEIGVKEGKSLAMWSEYFPEAEVHGLDLFSEIPMSEVGDYLTKTFNVYFLPKIHLHRGNQCDWLILEELRKYDFDVIIDDGSHNARDQMMTFFGLFNGKHYFIEDLHCNLDNFYSQGLPQEYSAQYFFSDIAVANDNTLYSNDIVFDDIEITDPRKIVCIKNYSTIKMLNAAQSDPVN